MEKLPVIRIQYSKLLQTNVSMHFHKLWGKGKEMPTDELMKQKVAEFQTAWQPYEEKVLIGLSELLDLSYRQNIIDVYIAAWFKSFSNPMVVGVMYKQDIFVDKLTHELIHRLLSDNTSVPYDSNQLLVWKKLFGDQHSRSTLLHIAVHAVHKAIYLDVLDQPKRLERDIAICHKYNATDYIAAWDYVNKNDYNNIIYKLKDSFSQREELKP